MSCYHNLDWFFVNDYSIIFLVVFFPIAFVLHTKGNFILSNNWALNASFVKHKLFYPEWNLKVFFFFLTREIWTFWMNKIILLMVSCAGSCYKYCSHTHGFGMKFLEFTKLENLNVFPGIQIFLLFKGQNIYMSDARSYKFYIIYVWVANFKIQNKK